MKEESKTKTKEEELRKLFQAAVSLCVQSGSMTPERAKIFYRSGEIPHIAVCVCVCQVICHNPLLLVSWAACVYALEYLL